MTADVATTIVAGLAGVVVLLVVFTVLILLSIGRVEDKLEVAEIGTRRRP